MRLVPALLLLLTACTQTQKAEVAQVTLAPAVVPAAVYVTEALQEIIPPAPIPPPPSCAPMATGLIVRWEVTSPAVYERRYQGVIWPGGSSGPTWGVGYDGGQATRIDIRRDWEPHPQADRLETTSGVAGQAARDRVGAGEWRGVLTPYPLAESVFQAASLPSYTASARRAFPGFEELPCGAQAALTSIVYNRGGQMEGDRRLEMREIRDRCVPAGDTACIAHEVESMCRLWPTTPGLCARRKDEARTARL